MIKRFTLPFAVFLVAFALALVACSSDDSDSGDSTGAGGNDAAAHEDDHDEADHAVGTYVANAGDFAGKAAADWDNAEVVRVEMTEFSFTPNELTFEAGKPYVLQLTTVGTVKHEFTAHEFFPSVAWRKAESGQSEVKAPYFTEIEVFPGQQVDLYFVPVTPGTYELVCEIEGHLEAGMQGTITVTGETPTSPAPDYVAIADGPWVTDGAAQVSAADWDTKEVITVELTEFAFGPDEIHLQVGQPYQLNFTNIGDVKHEATAPEFFQNVAFRKAEDASGEFKAPTLLEVETFAGMVTELFLIPTEAGTYELVCEIEGHFEAGMHGTIVVDPAGTVAAPPVEADHGAAVDTAGTYVANAGDFAGKAAADWDNAEVVRVEMTEFSFTPNELTFEAGKPYVLQLTTVGTVKHEFTAHEFFPSVAWRKAESGQSEVKAPYFTEIEVFPGQQVDLYFVPVTPGTYELVCEIEGHLEAGMQGTITVTGETPTSPAPDYVAIADGPWVTDGAAQVSAADWDTKEVITVELSEFAFGPDETHLQVGQPYQINFTNIGDVKHEATAPEFFQNVAFRKAQDASGEFKAPTLLEVETFAAMETELWLIPTKAGTYALVCEIEGHFEAGMHGTIIVE